MGVSPCKDRAKLRLEKELGLRVHLTRAMLRGLRLEPLARDAYEQEQGLRMAPVCVESLLYPWMRASLDGLSTDATRVVEIKCGEASYRFARRGRVPPYYYPQLQHQLMVTSLPQLDLWCWLKGHRGICIEVRRDDAYLERLLQAEVLFYTSLTPRHP